MTPELIAHIYGVPVEELFIAAAGGGAIWLATRVFIANLAARVRR